MTKPKGFPAYSARMQQLSTEILRRESERNPRKGRTEEEQRAVDRIRNKTKLRTSVPEWTVLVLPGGQIIDIRHNHPDREVGDALTMEALGLDTREQLMSILTTLAETCRVQGGFDGSRFDRLLQAMLAIAPRDQLEAMLAMQMAAAKDLSMTLYGMANEAVGHERQDDLISSFTKLASLSALQHQGLHKSRSNGQQVVTVKHVTIGEGGRAIVNMGERGPQVEDSGEAAQPPNQAKLVALPAQQEVVDFSLKSSRPLDKHLDMAHRPGPLPETRIHKTSK